MTDEPYKNRELDVRFQTLAEKIDENHGDTSDKIALLDRKMGDKHGEVMGFLEEIKIQTTKTNGKVSRHDMYLRAAIIAAPLITIIAGIVFYAYTQDRKALYDKIEATKEILELKKTIR